MEKLYEKLQKYAESDYYPFHMPGHKRRLGYSPVADAGAIDITEIDGFDDLHHAEDIIKEAEQRAAKLYDSEETKYLVNGSTCGLLSAIAGTVKPGGRILMARNCHKAVYHAAALHNLNSIYLYPKENTDHRMNGDIDFLDVEKHLEQDPEIEAVLITSPTYEGRTTDIRSIAAICHRHSVPLIVDQAHGAHFGFDSYFPESAVHEGADIVIHSLHKTLPSMTQTALIHMNGILVDRERVHRYLGIYQTSSPSYVLMASMDACIDMLAEGREALFKPYVEQLKSVRDEFEQLKHIKLINGMDFPMSHMYDYDPSKLVFSVKDTPMNGQELYQILLDEFHLQLEMAAGDYAIAMTSLMDTDEGYDRILRAIKEIDSRLDERPVTDYIRTKQAPYETVMKINSAEEADHRMVKIEESVGKISAVYAYIYPPGVPLIVPGERITDNFIDILKEYKACGLHVQGVSEEIKTVDKPVRMEGSRG